MIENSGVKVIGQDKHGPKYCATSLSKVITDMINNEQYFERRAKRMSTDIEKATALIEQSIAVNTRALDKLMDSERRIAEESKKVTGKVRDASQKLNDGLAKIEKLANFDRLERYVELLERAERAMTSLAELEQSGRLEKIAAAVR